MTNFKVSLRGGFSDRMGLKPVNTDIQYHDLDERSRIALSNMMNALFNHLFHHDHDGTDKYDFHLKVMSEVYLQPVEYSRPSTFFSGDRTKNTITETILEDDFDAALTVIEYVANYLSKLNNRIYRDIDVYDCFNIVFKQEYVGYRFVNEQIVPITNEEEIKEIEKAISNPYDNVHKHLEKALRLLSNRESPDYENSIKESISAVEAVCSDILGQKGSLGDTLKAMKKNPSFEIHPALEVAFNKLYGYTADASSGIRHAAGLGSAGSSFAEARYMLVSCSAFINYLMSSMAERVYCDNKEK